MDHTSSQASAHRTLRHIDLETDAMCCTSQLRVPRWPDPRSMEGMLDTCYPSPGPVALLIRHGRRRRSGATVLRQCGTDRDIVGPGAALATEAGTRRAQQTVDHDLSDNEMIQRPWH